MINVDYFNKWMELDNDVKIKKDETSITKYMPLDSIVNVYISNNRSMNRSFSIEFSKDIIQGYTPIKVQGVNIEVKEKSKIDKEKLYLVLTNTDREMDDTFLGFSACIFQSLVGTKNEVVSLKNIEKALDDYHNFFSYKKEISKMEEQGLIAELIYLNELIDKNGENSVINWLGSEKNKRDFIIGKKAIEIKSSRNQEQDIIHVSNENQLDNENLDELLLKLYVFDENESGHNVSYYIQLVHDQLKSYEMKKIFLAKIAMRGIDPINYVGKYKFGLEYVHSYIVDDQFPKITKKDIPSNVFDVKYRLNLSGIDYLEKE